MPFINYLSDVNTLHNEYFAVRHGESEANVANLISSSPHIAIQQHGLTPNGRTMVNENIQQHIKYHNSNNSYRIISSDFRRAHETANIIASNLMNFHNQKYTVELDERLRERYFGIYDNTNHDNYNTIWTNDENDSNKNDNDQVESVDSVRQRATSLIKDLEEKYENQIIFLVSHGDTLQILQTAFERMPNANQQRHLKHLERAEIRSLKLRRP